MTSANCNYRLGWQGHNAGANHRLEQTACPRHNYIYIHALASSSLSYSNQQRTTHNCRGNRSAAAQRQLCEKWSVANLAILSRLQDEGTLDAISTLDYLSYTTRIYQLLQRYDQVSVYLYDREYRRLQAQMGFRWGTEMSHLHTVWLKEQGPRASNNAVGAPTSKNAKPKGPTTGDGRTICKLFNSKPGCTFTDCKFAHVCSRPGCEEKHSASSHDSLPKN